MLLEQCLRSPLDVVDIFLGAVDAHLQLLNGENVSWRIMNMVNKLRTALLIVFSAYIGFIIAGFSLVGLADDSPMLLLMKTNQALAFYWALIQAGAVVALLAVVIGGLPLAVMIIRCALMTNRRSLGLLLVPGFSFLVLVLCVGFIFLVGTGRIHIAGVFPVVPSGNFPPGNRLMLAGLMLVFILGAIASTLAVWKMVSSIDPEQEAIRLAGRGLTLRPYAFAFVPAVITTASMLVMLVATLAWGGTAFSALPQVYAGNFGPWQTNTQVWFCAIVTSMTLCTLAGIFGLARSRSARTGT